MSGRSLSDREGQRVSELREPQLVTRAAEGDVNAFEELVRRYQLPIYRLCLGMLGNRHDAEDAAQDAFLTAWRAVGRFRGESKFSTWLYRLAVNRCLRQLSRRPAPAGEITERAGSLGDPEAEFEAVERMGAIAAAVGRLTPEQRVPFILREVEGLTYNEIAEVLGVTMTAVKSRLNRARVELARLLDEDR
jgi:RNA polymerase sigma-70 factor (ECF subfamily)